ncbi:MAG: PQQ-binding-like beta-propeller repeat protein [Planctomycetes bacterium]|nr:PQQ-binding-like beta-propeller repeat protein [Planctomycetota bacterium]
MLHLCLALALQTATTPDICGAWSGAAFHRGSSTPYGLEIERTDSGALAVAVSLPAIHVLHQPLGEFELRALDGGKLELGWLGTLTLGADGRTLEGTVASAFSPIDELPFTVRRVDELEFPARPELAAPLATPVWTYDARSPAWPGATFADGRVLVGVEDGRLLALDPRDGTKRWEFATGARLRSRASVEHGVVYQHSDDGCVYALDLATGKERWRVRLETEPIVRLPFDDPASRYDRFGSGVTVAQGKLFVGTHDGRVLALDPRDGKTLWTHSGNECVLAAPAVDERRVYFGGFDGRVRALDVATGKELWKFDTRKAVVSTPALAGERVIVGSRSYEFFGLDAASGASAWRHYTWFSWIESSAVVRDGSVYVGSSDTAAVTAYDARSGERRWSTDVHGWAWGEPAVGETRVYVGTCGQVGYPAPHRSGFVALDRESGKPAWRFETSAQDEAAGTTFGFPGTAALGRARVFAAGLDGKVRAFEP